MVTEQEIKDGVFAQRLAKDAVDNLLKQAGAKTQEETKQDNMSLDPETQRKVVEREIKMATDPDFDLAETAKQLAAKRMRERLSSPPAAHDGEAAKDKAKINQEIGATAKAMLDMGIPATVVAQYLVGSGAPAVPIAMGGGSQGLTLADVLTLVDRMNTNKASSELDKILLEMREDIKALKSGNSKEPQKPASALIELKELVSAMVDLGVVQRPGTGTVVSDGEPIEVVKEKNRHAEKMEQIKIEGDYKTKLGAAVAELPERVGEGIASRMLAGGGTAAVKAVPQTYRCTHKLEDSSICNTEINIPQGATLITCPKCGTKYGH